MITITHTHADGTLISGSRKGDGVYEILTGLRASGQGNWRWFRSLGQIGLGQSRDRAAQAWKLDRAAEALRNAGHEVTVETDDSQRRTFAEAEAERYERAEQRADYHEERAQAAESRAAGHWQAERNILDFIPPGQPILVGHHSEGRHRRDLARADSHMRHGLEEIGKRDHHEYRAAAAGRYQAGRESVPVTLRRIEKLAADERGILRDIAAASGGAWLEKLNGRLADVREQLAYWREHVAAAEAAGVKVWTRADFAKGDYVQCGGHRWYRVERASPKSLSVPTGLNMSNFNVITRAVVTHALGPSDWTEKITYEKVTGRMSAVEMAAALESGQITERREVKPAAS